MRPLRLLLNGFGSYREHTELDLSDVDFFVLTGPTGAGKSTIIDGLCFALYGTVPRWGKGNVIRNALAPSTSECRVCVVFEASGARYAAVRQLRRDKRGQVTTKEARLDRLDGSVPADADLTKVLEASAEQIAEGPDQVTDAVTELLGIGYEHFTQCVLLPQGRFAEFLQAKPSERQGLLAELLAYTVYGDIGQRARERAKLAASHLGLTERRLAEAGEVTDEQIAATQRRVAELTELTGPVDKAIETMDGLRDEWKDANRAAQQLRDQVTALGELRRPAGVTELSAQLTEADELIAHRTEQREHTDRAEAEAEQACSGLTELATLRAWRDGYTRSEELTAEQATHRTGLDDALTAEQAAATALADAERAETEATEAVRLAERAHRAVALATDLHVGEPCPVCQQEISTLPHHDVPADLDQTRSAVTTAGKAVTSARKRLDTATKTAAAARATVENGEKQLARVAATLAGAPAPGELAEALDRRAAADTALVAARTAARTARTDADTAVRDRTALQAKEQAAWSELRAGRDRFVALAAPSVDGTDLATAWQTLLDWAGAQREQLAAKATELGAAEDELRRQGTEAAEALTALLREHGVDVGAAPARAPAELAAAAKGAERDLADLRTRQETSAALAREVEQLRRDQEVAAMLGKLLQSDHFERWLCVEALDSLVMEASQTLLLLSGGQYELIRGERNDLVVVDHNDAGTQRPVNTLSGGETFQASLALALALSNQVVELSGGRRDLNSMFLDEGFGTLDDTTLDTVAATLEKLAQESDRMVGIVTHVAALAERVPVQFAVRRYGASSKVSRVDV
jgi:exonuclease SbcC